MPIHQGNKTSVVVNVALYRDDISFPRIRTELLYARPNALFTVEDVREAFNNEELAYIWRALSDAYPDRAEEDAEDPLFEHCTIARKIREHFRALGYASPYDYPREV